MNHAGFTAVALSAKIEAEIAQLERADADAFRAELGIREPALDRMIRASYRLLGRISFFTAGEDECRAGTIRRGTIASVAAGTIHSDIEKGFIRAELVGYDDLVKAGSWDACKAKGLLRLEGKETLARNVELLLMGRTPYALRSVLEEFYPAREAASRLDEPCESAFLRGLQQSLRHLRQLRAGVLRRHILRRLPEARSYAAGGGR